MSRGLFVSFEGIEGCGKSTQIRRLSEWLDECSISHLITREPGGTALGEGIRQILLASETIHLTAAAELLLFFASRSQNMEEKIKPALERHEIVLCDRFYHASMAYQGYGRGIPLDFIDRLTELVCSGMRPQITVLLDLDPSIGLDRARDRDQSRGQDKDRFEREGIGFYKRIRRGYMELARREPARIKVIPADRPVDEVHHDVLGLLGLEEARLQRPSHG